MRKERKNAFVKKGRYDLYTYFVYVRIFQSRRRFRVDKGGLVASRVAVLFEVATTVTGPSYLPKREGHPGIAFQRGAAILRLDHVVATGTDTMRPRVPRLPGHDQQRSGRQEYVDFPICPLEVHDA